MKFRSDLIFGLLTNTGDIVGKTIQPIRKEERVVVSQGYGANGAVPLRFLAYIVSIWHLLRQLPLETCSAELYFALHGVLRANHQASQKDMGENVNLMSEAIRRYGERTHQEVSGNVRVLIDRDITGDNEVAATVEKLTELAIISGDADPAISGFFMKRGGHNAYRYAAEHMLYMRDPVSFGADESLPVLVPEMSTSMDHLIMVGGPAEKIFHKVRMEVSRKLVSHNRWHSHQFFTPIGDPPTYHAQPGEPLWKDRGLLPEKVGDMLATFRNVSTEFGVQKSVTHDMVVLLTDAAGCFESFRLVGERSKQALVGGLPITALDELQRGWNVLRST